MNRLLLSFVPYNIVQDLMEHPGESPVGREQRFEAVALFADVSGFTAISEALGKTGKQGTEELTRILNSYFDPMIDLIQSYGGIIGKFGGDAMTALFPYTRRNQAATVRRAIQCALDMQSRMHRYAAIPTPAGIFGLAMKAGLSMGTVLCTSVGEPAIRLEYLVAGELLDVCAEAEHHASKGEVVIHHSLQPLAGAVEVIEERHGFLCVGKLPRRASRQPLQTTELETKAEIPEFVASFLHPLLVERVNQGRSGFINEHRKVTVLFVSFNNFDYDHDPQVSAKLQTFLADVIRLVQQYDGYLNKVDMGDKGSKFIVLFGAPVAHENDEERALQCALDLIKAWGNEPAIMEANGAPPPPSPLRIGVNTGFVYCGQVGSSLRQEYTVMGDAVNLSARMMQASKPNQILVSGFTRHYVADKFNWESFEPIFVKGKTEPIPIFAVQDFKGQSGLHLQEPAYALPMVGRKEELQEVEPLLALVLEGKGQIVGITAEAGMGKSRLAAEIIKRAVQSGLSGYGGECQSYGSETPYLVWRNLWRGFFGLEQDWAVEKQLMHLERQLSEIDPALVPRLPLLAAVLNLPIPENDLIRSLDPQLQKASREALLVSCLRTRAKNDSSPSSSQPLLLVLEDCHWIDPLSIDLLETISRSLTSLPVLLILLYRPPENENVLQLAGSWHGRLKKISKPGLFTELRLQEFGPLEVTELIGLKLRQLFPAHEGESPTSLPEVLLKRIIDKAEGNPFYIDEMLNLIHDRKIELEDNVALEALDLPDSLYSLIISRIDQLQEDEKIALKVASVIGRLFKAAWLWGVYPQLGAPALVRHQLESLSQLELTPQDKPEPELEYLFKHIVTQEVAYESLAVATRATLHEQTGHFIEQAYPARVDSYLDQLVYHFEHSQNQDKQRYYFRKAGQTAQSTYANEAAVKYYRQLLPLLAGPEHPPVLWKLGEVLQILGNKVEEEETAYHEALTQSQAAKDEWSEAQSRIFLGYLMYRKGLHEEALEYLYQALEKGRELNDKHLISHSLGNIGIVYQQQGQYDRALSCHQQHLQIVTELGDPSAMHKAIGNIGTVYHRQGELIKALEHHNRKLQMASELGDRPGISIATGSIGNIYYGQGDYFKALEYYGQLLQVAVEIGYRRGICEANGSIGNLYYRQGEYPQALACYLQMLQIALDLGVQQLEAIALANMAEIYTLQERLEEANKVYILAIQLCRKVNFLRILSGALYDYAALKFRQEHYREALFLNTEAFQLATQIRFKDIEFKTQVLGIILQTRLDQNNSRINNAISELEEMLSKWTGEEQQAALHYEIWKLAKTEEQHCRMSAELYRTLYPKTPNLEYRQRYEELTGETLAAPPALPLLPELQIQTKLELEPLLARLETND